jgi:hypothetical protein
MSSASPSLVVRAAVPALLVATVALVPFLGKAFTVDDAFFLFSARHALVDPLHPTSFELTWDRVPERASRIAPTGPVMAWLLVPSVLAGGSESLAHLVSLAFLWVAALATVSLALRFGLTTPWASGAGVILVATPTLLGMAGTAMPDVPAMALGVAGIDRLVAWRDGALLRDGVLAAVLLGIAALTRTHLIALLGVGLLLVAGDVFSASAWRRAPRARWLPLAAAPLLTASVALLARDPDPGAGSIVGTALRLSSASHLASNSVAYGVNWVLAMAFALPWAAMRWRKILRSPWALIAGTASAALLLRVAHGEDAPYVFAPVAGLGVACLADVLADAARRRDGVQFALGAWLLAPLPCAVYWHFPSKYLLAAAPAAAILVARAMAADPRVGRYVFAGTVVLGMALGVAILRADAAFAEVGRSAVRALVVPHVRAGRQVWYLGHWGFQWYADEAGARCWSAAPPYPVAGDLIAYADNLASALDRRELETLTHLGRIEDRRPGGRIMSKEAGAGFYSNGWGYLPWAWGDDVIDAVDLWLAVPRPEEPGAPFSHPAAP